MRRVGLAATVCALAAFAFGASTAGAARVDEPCFAPSGGNGATTCTVILRIENTDVTNSPTIIECFGEDFLIHIEAQAVATFVFRPGDQFASLEHATVTSHGTGTGVVTGTQVILNQQGSATIDNLPNGGFVLHETTPGEVITHGSADNLVLTIELQEVFAPDGTIVNQTLNAQAKCGSTHEHAHEHA